MDIIKPRILGGFPEFNPAQQVAMDRALRVIRRWYERFGFVPLETSAVEPKDVLTAKASTVTKQIYTLSRLAGERELNETLDRL